MAEITTQSASRCHIKASEGVTFETGIVHRGAQHSRIAVTPDQRKSLEGVPGAVLDGENNVLVPNEMIQEIQEGQIDPGSQKGGISAEQRATSFLEGRSEEPEKVPPTPEEGGHRPNPSRGRTERR